jgi:hypothetical protein
MVGEFELEGEVVERREGVVFDVLEDLWMGSRVRGDRFVPLGKDRFSDRFAPAESARGFLRGAG